MGQNDLAALKCLNLASCYMDKGEYETAKTYLDKYETCSYLYTHPERLENGIAPWFINKGKYYLNVGILDSAEIYYRKALEYLPHLHDGALIYHGLQETYRQLHQPDSVQKYSLLYADRAILHFDEDATDATKRMKSLYNYSVEQDIAQKKSAENQRLKSIILAASLLFFFALFILYHLYYRRNKQKALEISDLKYKLQSNLSALRSAEDQLLTLSQEKAEHADQLAEQSREVEMLKENIARYEKRLGELGASRSGMNLSNSPIVKRLKYCLQQPGKRHVTDEDWQELKDTIGQMYPTFYHITNAHNILSEKEYHICLLVKAGFTSSDIEVLTGTTNGTTIRQRLMKKVFGTEGKAKDFDQKILSI